MSTKRPGLPDDNSVEARSEIACGAARVISSTEAVTLSLKSLEMTQQTDPGCAMKVWVWFVGTLGVTSAHEVEISEAEASLVTGCDCTSCGGCGVIGAVIGGSPYLALAALTLMDSR